MTERFIDKEIKVLQGLITCKEGNFNQHLENALFCANLKLSSDELWSITNSYEKQGLINIYYHGEISNHGEGQDADYIQVRILNKKEISDLLDASLKKSPKILNPIIKLKSLELIAKKIGELDTGEGLIRFLKGCGVDGELILLNIKWQMIYNVFEYFAYSALKEDQWTLFKIIEEAVHPMMHAGDREKAFEVQDEFSTYLMYDDYVFYANNKIVKATDELIQQTRKVIEDRQKERKDKKLLNAVDNGLQNLIVNMTTTPVQQQAIQKSVLGTKKTVPNKQLTEVLSKIIYTATLDNNTVKINGEKLAKPQFDGENHRFYEYACQHPDTKITNKKLKSVKINITKIAQTIYDLGFKKPLNQLFFPSSSIKAFVFHPHVTEADLKKANLSKNKIDGVLGSKKK